MDPKTLKRVVPKSWKQRNALGGKSSSNVLFKPKLNLVEIEHKMRKMREEKARAQKRDLKLHHANFVSESGFGLIPDKMTLSLDDEAFELVERIQESLDSLVGAWKGGVKVDHNVNLGGLKDLYDKASSHSYLLVTIPLLALILAGAYRLAKKPTVGYKATVGTACAAFTMYVAYKSWTWVKPYIDEVRTIAQALADTQIMGAFRSESGASVEVGVATPDALLKAVVSLCSAVISYVIVGQAPEGKKMKECANMIAMQGRLMDGAEITATRAVELMELIVNFVRTSILGLDAFHLWVLEDPELEKWRSDIDKLSLAAQRNELRLNQANLDNINALLNKGYRYQSSLRTQKDAVRLSSMFSTYMALLKRIQAPFERANLRSAGMRMVPLTIMVAGPPGCGKSTLCKPMVTEVVARVIPKLELDEFLKNPDLYMFVRVPEEKFWSGYRSQFATIYDDFGQAKDVEGNADGEPMNIIRNSNSFPNVLHMADVESKGTVYFRSKIIFATTNQRTLDPKSITEPEALRRRFDLPVHALVRKEYATADTANATDPWNRRLDVTKLKSSLDTDALEYRLVRWDNSADLKYTYVGEPMSYEELIDLAELKYRDHEANFESYSELAQQRLQKAVAARMAPMEASVVPEKDVFTSQSGLSAFDAFAITDDEKNALRDAQKLEAQFASQSGLIMPNLEDLFDSDSDSEGERDRFVNCLDADNLTDQLQLFLSKLGVEDVSAKSFLEHMYYSDPKACIKLLDDLGPTGVVRVMCAATKIPANFEILSKGLPARVEDVESFSSRAKQMWKSCMDSVSAKISEINQRYPMLKTIGLALAATSVVAAMVCAFSKPSTEEPEDGASFVPESAPGYRKRSRQGKNRQLRRSRVPAYYGNEFEAEGGVDQNCEQMIGNVLEHNVYEILLKNGAHRVGFMTFVRERRAICPTHFAYDLMAGLEEGFFEESDEVLFRSVGSKKREFKLTLGEYLDLPYFMSQGRDCTDTLFPISVPLHRDITGYFVTGETHAKLQDCSTVLVVPNGPRVKEYISSRTRKILDKRVVNFNFEENFYNVALGYEYDAKTDKGDCGALLFVMDSSVRGAKILGFHVAGSSERKGFSAAISNEFLTRVPDKDLEENLEVVEFIEGEDSEMVMKSEGAELSLESLGFKVIGKSPKSVHSPSSTVLRRSVLHSKWKPALTKPAHLRPFEKDGVIIDPALKATAKYAPKPNIVSEKMLDAAADELISFLINNSKPMAEVPKILGYAEAVKGVEGVEFCESIPRNTSAGYPWCIEPAPGLKGKQRFWGTGEEYDLDGPKAKELEKRVMDNIAAAAAGKRVEYVYTDFPKDERRLMEKVDDGKTRKISASPVDLTIATRMYFGDFSRWIMSNRIDNGCAVGINPYKEWDMLYRRLIDKGNSCIAGDFSNNDGNLRRNVLETVLKVIEAYYFNSTEEERAIRQMLFMEVYNSKHIMGDTIYEWNGALPSGHPLTTIVNCLANHLHLRVAYMKAHGGDLNCLANFSKDVYACTYGDDNILAVDDAVHDVYNPATLEKFLQEIGMPYTSETKGAVNPEFRPAEDCEFLKRGFRHDDVAGCVVAPLDLDTVLEIPYWTKKGNVGREITCSNVTDALSELSLHGKEVYKYWSRKILDACRDELGFAPPVVQWAQVFKNTLDREDYY